MTIHIAVFHIDREGPEFVALPQENELRKAAIAGVFGLGPDQMDLIDKAPCRASKHYIVLALNNRTEQPLNDNFLRVLPSFDSTFARGVVVMERVNSEIFCLPYDKSSDILANITPEDIATLQQRDTEIASPNYELTDDDKQYFKLVHWLHNFKDSGWTPCVFCKVHQYKSMGLSTYALESYLRRANNGLMPDSCSCPKFGASSTECPVCFRSASKRCTRCRETVYCSVTCQKADWSEHRKQCRAK